MENLREYQQQTIWLPDQRMLKKIISVPGKVIYINLAAAPTANVILLVQEEDLIT